MNPRAASVTLMLAKSLLVLAALFAVACSGSDPQSAAGSGGSPASAPLVVVPAGLAVAPRIGNNSVFHVTALTLRQGSDGAELYAAVKNVGDVPGCNASFSVTLYDKDGETVGNGISGLMLRRYFHAKGGNIAGCVLPGDLTMVAINSVSLDTAIEDVESLDYLSQYWSLTNIEPIAGVSLRGVEAVARSSGVAYTGALVNGLDTVLTSPTVAVFPLDASGRPLGVAYGGSSVSAVALPPGGAWDFETAAVEEAGVSFDAYPMGGP